MRLKLRSIRGTITTAFVLLLVMSQMFLSQLLASEVVGDRAQVSPGKIPPEEDNHYLGTNPVEVKLEYPKSFILQETVGDLSFNITLTNETHTYRRIEIYIPPEFQVTASKSHIWTSITNDYGNIGISKTSVSISNGTDGIKSGRYWVRIFDVKAPSIVGRYFFKVFTDGKSIGMVNFPSVVVSADPNPAYISGTVRYGGHLNASFYGHRIDELLSGTNGGKVQATGITVDGRIVVGQAFFNSSSSEYTLYGLAEGRYRLNATAAGFPPAELPYEIAVKAGQSMENVDIFVKRSPILSVVALSRWRKQPIAWGDSRTITLEVLDMWNVTVGTLNATVDPSKMSHEFAYNGSTDLDGHIPQDKEGYVAGIGPGRYYIRIRVKGYIQPSAANEWAWKDECAVVFTGNEQNKRIEILLEKTGSLEVTVHFMNSTQTLQESRTWWNGTLTVEAYDLTEEIRARESTDVPVNRTTASVELTGMPPGEYLVFARWTLKESMDAPRLYSVGAGYVSVGDVYLPSVYRYGPTGHRVTIGEGLNKISFRVVLQGGLNLTVFPITWQKPFDVTAWKYRDSSISVEIRDRYGLETHGSFRLSQENQILPDGGSGPVNNTASVIGLDDGIYSIYVFTYGYVQRQIVYFSVKRGEFADISVRVMPGIQIDLTVVFEKERIISPIDTYVKYWNTSDPRVPVRFEVYDSKAKFVAAGITYVLEANITASCTVTLAGFKKYHGGTATRWVNYYDTTDGSSQKDYGLEPDLYTIKVYIPGYHQPIEPTIDARTAGNMSVSLVLALHRMGRLYGMVHTFSTYYENYTRISWVSVDAIGEEMALWTSTLDGAYELWMVPGSYLVMYSLPAYETKALRIHIPDGSDVRMDAQLLLFGMKLRSSVSFLQLWITGALTPIVSSRDALGKRTKTAVSSS